MTTDIDSYIEKILTEKDVFSKAKYIQYLTREKNMKLIDLADRLQMKPSYLCHLKRLNKLPDIIVDSYYSNSINISQLFLLSRINNIDKMIKIYEDILKNNYTIRQTEDRIREFLYDIKTKGEHLKAETKKTIINNLKNKYPDVEFTIIQTRTQGKIIIRAKGNLTNTSKVIKKIADSI